MLLLLFIPIFYAVARAHRYLQLFSPSNFLIARVRSSPPRWRTATLLLAMAYALIWATHYLSMVIQNGAPGWLNLVALVLVWDAIKTALLGVHAMLRAAGRVAMRCPNGQRALTSTHEPPSQPPGSRG